MVFETATRFAGSLGSIEPSHALPHEEILIEKIRADADLNSRSGELDVKNLAENMKAVGLMQPVVVTKDGDGYRLVAGFRRLAAAKSLEWKTIPAVIVVADVEQSRLLNLAENLERKNLRLYDTMRTVYDLSDKKGIQTARIAREAGMKESRAASMIKVWPKLAPSLKEKWSKVPDPSWEPTMYQLTQWSSLSPPEQNREWSKWSNDTDEAGTELDGEEVFPDPEPQKKQCHKRRKTSAVRAMVKHLSDDKSDESRAQVRALLWALGERNHL
jgi:ParB/RepB/Spo0J family partition protein